ncbi:hypothetical protein [uncultured Parasutterella sp.]|uniref:hypothetical protein n=1 Tax=uncultured Parasutterella sp. TaxID=1263098 RepID=UPI0034A3F16A
MTRFFAHASITSRMIEFCDLSGSSETIWRMTDIVTSVSIARTSFVPLSLIVYQLLGLLRRDFSEANSCTDDLVLLADCQHIRP